MPDFPVYETPADAARAGCWRCGIPHDAKTPQRTENAPGRGQYTLWCSHCSVFHFFDLRTAPCP